MSIVHYDYVFKSLSDKDLEPLEKKIEESIRKFVVVFATTEPCVYKIVNHFENKEMFSEKNCKTIDGQLLEDNFDHNWKQKANKMSLEELRSTTLSDLEGKWLIVPNMSAKWDRSLAFMFFNEVKDSGALGMIFHSKGDNNFGKVLIQQTTLDVFQFPGKVYDKYVVEDDNW